MASNTFFAALNVSRPSAKAGEVYEATLYGYGGTPEEAFREVQSALKVEQKHWPKTKAEGKPKVGRTQS